MGTAQPRFSHYYGKKLQLPRFLDIRSVVQIQGWFGPPGYIFQYLDIFLIVTTAGLAAEFSMWETGVLLNIVQCIKQHPQNKELPSPKAIVPELRSPF